MPQIKSKSTRIVLLAAICVGLAYCGKDQFTSKPQLEFIKAESYEVPRGGIIRFFVQFTDKEGDIGDSLFISSKTPACPNSDRVLGWPIPNFPSPTNVKGEFEVAFSNGVFLPGYPALPSPACGRPDTTTYYFWVSDKAGNISDTIQSDKPLIIQN